MNDGMKLVDFRRYCRTCKNRATDETKDPCNECLAEGGRLYSHKPLKYEKGGAGVGRKKRKSTGNTRNNS